MRAMKLFESFKISLKEEGLLSACYRVLKVISRAAERFVYAQNDDRATGKLKKH